MRAFSFQQTAARRISFLDLFCLSLSSPVGLLRPVNRAHCRREAPDSTTTCGEEAVDRGDNYIWDSLPRDLRNSVKSVLVENRVTLGKPTFQVYLRLSPYRVSA